MISWRTGFQLTMLKIQVYFMLCTLFRGYIFGGGCWCKLDKRKDESEGEGVGKRREVSLRGEEGRGQEIGLIFESMAGTSQKMKLHCRECHAVGDKKKLRSSFQTFYLQKRKSSGASNGPDSQMLRVRIRLKAAVF